MGRKMGGAMVGLAVLAGACGSAEPVEIGRAELIAAVDGLEGEPPARVEMTLDYDFSGDEPDFSLTSVGEIDHRSGSARTVVDVTPALEATAEGELPPGVTREVETIVAGDDLFITGQAFWPLGGDAEFVKIDTTAITNGLGLRDLLGPSGAEPGDATDAIGQLRALGGFEVVGREDIGEWPSVSTTHVRGTVLMGDALDEFSQEQQDGLQQFYGVAFEGLEDVVVPVDAFVDGDGRLRRMVQRFPIDALFGAAAGADLAPDEIPQGTYTVTIDLDGFGEVIDIEVPEGAVDVTNEVVEQFEAMRSNEPADDASGGSSEPVDDFAPLSHDVNQYGAPGTCFTDVEVQVVPCDKPHNLEVIAEVDLGEGDHPGEDELRVMADEACADALAALDSEGRFSVIASQPSRRAWDTGRRNAVCFASTKAAAQVTGSLVLGDG